MAFLAGGHPPDAVHHTGYSAKAADPGGAPTARGFCPSLGTMYMCVCMYVCVCALDTYQEHAPAGPAYVGSGKAKGLGG